MRILVVEDEKKVAAAIREGLEGEQYAVTVAHDGDTADRLLAEAVFDALVLDLMLPGRSGLEVLIAMRRRSLRTPVLLLTARDSLEDRVMGLDCGADDYLVKPFAFPELLARIRALLRRGGEPLVCLALADLQMDVARRVVTRSGQPLDLTEREFDLLAYLLRHPRQVVSREMLARDIWKSSGRGAPLDNVMDVHVARLRKKVDHGFTPRLIHTVRGVGFVLREGAG